MASCFSLSIKGLHDLQDLACSWRTGLCQYVVLTGVFLGRAHLHPTCSVRRPGKLEASTWYPTLHGLQSSEKDGLKLEQCGERGVQCRLRSHPNPPRPHGCQEDTKDTDERNGFCPHRQAGVLSGTSELRHCWMRQSEDTT